MIKYIFLSFFLLLTFPSVHSNELNKAESSIEQGQFDKAQIILENWLDSKPNSARAHYLLADVFVKKNQLDDAEDAIEKALSKSPSEEHYWLRAAGIYGSQAQQSSIFSKLGYAKDSKKALDKAYQLNPKNIDTIAGLIQFNLRAPGIAGGDEEQIMPLLAELKRLDPISAVNIEALILTSNKQTKKLADLYNNALKKHPDSIEILFQSGIYFMEQKQYQQAFTNLNKAAYIEIKEDDKKSLSKTKHMALYQSSKASALSGIELEQAKKNLYVYMDLTNKVVDEAWIRFRLGQILIHSGQIEYGAAQFEQVEQLSPDKRLRKELSSFKKSFKL